MSADTVIAISAAVIALASLFVSIWSAAVTRKHNRLSVTPHLKVDCFHSPNEPIKITLINNGLGTAIIKRFTVCLDGVPVSGVEAAGLSEALPRIGLVGGFYAYTPATDDALSAGEQMVILSFAVPDHDPKEMGALRASLARIAFRIHYESMYGDTFVLNRNALGAGESRA